MFSLLSNQNIPFAKVELFSHNVTVFVLCIVIGVFVDIDHVIDIIKGYAFGSIESRFKEGRLIILFHGIENGVILAALSIAFPFLIFPSTSYICHMIMDMFGNDVPFGAYSYLIRFGKKLMQI